MDRWRGVACVQVVHLHPAIQVGVLRLVVETKDARVHFQPTLTPRRGTR
jgi:hypothetical protein